MNPIAFAPIAPPRLIESASGGGPSQASGSFADLLREGMNRLQDLDRTADELGRKLLAGEPVELHRVILAGEEAGLAFDFMLAVRNKVTDAYQEIMRMQV